MPQFSRSRPLVNEQIDALDEAVIHAKAPELRELYDAVADIQTHVESVQARPSRTTFATLRRHVQNLKPAQLDEAWKYLGDEQRGVILAHAASPLTQASTMVFGPPPVRLDTFGATANDVTSSYVSRQTINQRIRAFNQAREDAEQAPERNNPMPFVRMQIAAAEVDAAKYQAEIQEIVEASMPSAPPGLEAVVKLARTARLTTLALHRDVAELTAVYWKSAAELHDLNHKLGANHPQAQAASRRSEQAHERMQAAQKIADQAIDIRQPSQGTLFVH